MTFRSLYRKTHYALKLPGTGRTWKWVAGIASAMILFATVLVGDKNLFRLFSLYQEREQVVSQIAELKDANQKLQQQIKELRVNPQAVEPIAREELGLVRSGEIVYRFVPPTTEPTNNR